MEIIKSKLVEKVPEKIEVEYPYVVLGDFEHVFGRFEGVLGKKKVDEFEVRVASVLAEVSPDLTNFVSLKIKKITDEVEVRIKRERSVGGKVGVVQLDRYIDGGESNDCFRLEISRGVTGGLMPRPGCELTVDEQFRNLASWVTDGNFDRLLVVDDVLAFGDTLTPMLNGFKELIPETELKVLVGLAASGGGWNGLERVTGETGVPVEAVTVVKAGEKNEWTSGLAMPALRDFTFLGGKIAIDEKTNERLNFPYFLPFSLPVISFMPKERRYEASITLMNISIEVVEEMERGLGRSLTMGDLQEAGFGMPSVRMECLRDVAWTPEIGDSVWEYLQYNKHLLEDKATEILEEANK